MFTNFAINTTERVSEFGSRVLPAQTHTQGRRIKVAVSAVALTHLPTFGQADRTDVCEVLTLSIRYAGQVLARDLRAQIAVEQDKSTVQVATEVLSSKFTGAFRLGYEDRQGADQWRGFIRTC